MHLPLTPLRFLLRATDQYPNKEGIVDGQNRFTYGQFGNRCLCFANALVQIGVRPGEVVAYLGFNSHPLLESYYSIPACKAIFCPINARLSEPEIIGILNDCQAGVLILDHAVAIRLSIVRTSCPLLRTIITLQPNGEADYGYEQLISGLATPLELDWTTINEIDVAQVFYTSGTSGKPKGVMHSHRSLYLHALTTALFYNQRDAGVELYPYQLYHANGWGRPHTATMLGLKQVLLKRFRPIEVLESITREEVTHIGLVPTMAHDLLSAAAAYKDCPKLRQITLGGAISTPDLLQRLEERFQCTCVTGYGLTESGPVIASSFEKSCFAAPSSVEKYTRKAMAGWPIVGSELRVIDPYGNDVPRGTMTIGEIAVRSDSVMEGYLNDPEGTQAALKDGWLLTGDLGTCDCNGYVQVVDRAKDIIVSGGENISSLELESAIQGCPGVQECAVIAVPHERWGETPMAIVVPECERRLTQEELVAHLKGRIAAFKIPRRWEFISEALPRTSSGKVRKTELRLRYSPARSTPKL